MALALVAPNRAGLNIEPIHGIDPALGALRIQATGVVPDELVATPLVSEAWRVAVMWGRTALGFEIVGNARSALALAIEHAKERVQFGQPIGAFQAVKHRLAESCIAIEAAEAALGSVLMVPSSLSAMVAKSMSGRAARVTATNALQVLGAMGFTAEHTFHHHQKRMAALDQLLGSADQLPTIIGQEVLDEGHAPILVHLQNA
jgi:alkylation response protein AidB-like acyl-CoA dehydrogenase